MRHGRLVIQERTAPVGGVGTEYGVIGDAQARSQAHTHPVLGYVAQPGSEPLAWGGRREIHPVHVHGSTGGRTQPGDGLGKLALSVPGHPGYADDLAGADRQVDTVQCLEAPVVQAPQADDLQLRPAGHHRWRTFADDR